MARWGQVRAKNRGSVLPANVRLVFVAAFAAMGLTVVLSASLFVLQRRAQVTHSAALFNVVLGMGTLTLLGLLTVALLAIRREFRRRTELTEFQSRLAGIITHDLRSPLSAILATATLLNRQLKQENADLRRIIGSARRIDRLLGLLTAFTSMHLSGEVALTPERIELGTLARQAMDQVTHGNPNIQLDLEIKRDSAGEWDRLLIRTALSTLLDGLVRRSRVGARLSVVVTREGEDAVMTVRAPTAVLPPRERLFDRDPSGELEDSVFPDGDPAHPHTISYSHGIGLYVCRAILSAHGGSLELTEDAPEAVTFVARLPHAETVRLTVPKAAPPPRATTAPVP